MIPSTPRQRRPHLERYDGVGVDDEIDRDIPPGSDLANRHGDPCDPFLPALAAVAGDQHPENPALAQRLAGRPCDGVEQRIDPGVTGYMYFAAYAFAPKVFRSSLGRGQQQVCPRIDCAPELLFRPRACRVIGSQPGFDVSDRNVLSEGRLRGAERARRIPLDDQHRRLVRHQLGAKRMLHFMGVEIGVRDSPTAKLDPLELFKRVGLQIKVRMLTRRNNDGSELSIRKRLGEWGKLNGFGAGAHHKPEFYATQDPP